MNAFNLPPGCDVHDIPGNEYPVRQKKQKPKRRNGCEHGKCTAPSICREMSDCIGKPSPTPENT